jgi:Protein of unknown function (DUF2845)
MTASSQKSGPIDRPLVLPALAVALLALMISTRAAADSSLRCNGRIVSVGATSYEVLDKCGRPDHREAWQTDRDHYVQQFYDYEKERFILPRLIVGPIQMERWTYNFGSQKFIRYLLFQNGELIDIKTGDKGTD